MSAAGHNNILGATRNIFPPCLAIISQTEAIREMVFSHISGAPFAFALIIDMSRVQNRGAAFLLSVNAQVGSEGEKRRLEHTKLVNIREGASLWHGAKMDPGKSLHASKVCHFSSSSSARPLFFFSMLLVLLLLFMIRSIITSEESFRQKTGDISIHSQFRLKANKKLGNHR